MQVLPPWLEPSPVPPARLPDGREVEVTVWVTHSGSCLRCGLPSEAGVVEARVLPGFEKLAEINFRDCHPKCSAHTRTAREAVNALLVQLSLPADTKYNYTDLTA